MEALQAEVTPFGIHTTIVNPGFFRTELLTQESTTYAEPSIEDYAERHAARREWYAAQNRQQSGDPAKLARALVMIIGQQPPPRRFIAEQKVQDLQQQINAYRDLSTSMAVEKT
jgi:NAD(P)-dependent dehydrogenase (short-subunit alcohol dehydrogenase family)